MSRARVPGKGAVVGVTVLTAAVLALAVTRTWVSGTVDDPVVGQRVVAAGGRAVAPAALGLTLAAGAGALASTVVGRWGRIIAGLIVATCAASVLVLAGGVGMSPGQALDHSSAGRAGAIGRASGAAVSAVAASPWVWVSVALAAALAVEGVVVLVAARRWSGLSARYDAPATSTELGEASRAGPAAETRQNPTADDERRRAARASVEDWDRLSAGEDPTR